MKSVFITSALLASVVAAAHSGHGRFDSEKIVTNASNSEWDYIVVGAGPSGIVVAQRFAEAGKNTLLLETGGPSYAFTGGNSTTTWNTNGLTPYDVPSQNSQVFTISSWACQNTPGGAGCILGGGQSVNAMVFVPPPAHDFDAKWPLGWKWKDVESSAQALYARNPGTVKPSMDGKWYDTAEYDIMRNFLAKNFNFSSVDGIQEPERKTKAYSHPPWNMQNGMRAGAVRTYLPLAQAKDNFALQMYTTVIRVVRTGSIVTGVEVEDSHTGVRSVINIRKRGGRVILAAGSMTTPRLLINSGIGSTTSISIVQNGSANITLPSRKEWIQLPVGQEIKDHPIVNVYFNTTANLTLYNFKSPPLVDQVAYNNNRTGAAAQGSQRLIFWDSFVGSDGITRYIQGTTSVYKAGVLLVKFYLTHGLQSVGALQVTSTGNTILSSTPYFSNAADKAGLESYITSFLASARSSGVMTPTNATAVASQYVTDSFSQGTHFVGTAPMGTMDGRKGGLAVVDTNTKVFGTDNLFVVDASIHVDLPTGNTQAIVMVVAEHAARKILACK